MQTSNTNLSVQDVQKFNKPEKRIKLKSCFLMLTLLWFIRVKYLKSFRSKVKAFNMLHLLFPKNKHVLYHMVGQHCFDKDKLFLKKHSSSDHTPELTLHKMIFNFVFTLYAIQEST